MRPLALLGALFAFLTIAAIVLTGDAMATCQTSHSFDVCHDALN